MDKVHDMAGGCPGTPFPKDLDGMKVFHGNISFLSADPTARGDTGSWRWRHRGLGRQKLRGDANGAYPYFHASREKQLSREARGVAVAEEHPPVPAALWGRLRGRSPRSLSRAGCAGHAPEPNPSWISWRCCPSVQNQAGKVGVSVAGQEMGQGIACTNSPLKGVSTCS